MVPSPRRLSPQVSSDALTETAAGSSSGAHALGQRISKAAAATRAAAHIGSVVDDCEKYNFAFELHEGGV